MEKYELKLDDETIRSILKEAEQLTEAAAAFDLAKKS